MTTDTVGVLTSTVSALTDDALLAQTRKFAHLEHHVEVTVIDHLREIHTRRLHLRRGFSSLFDYAVRELGYSDSAASRRISALKLCEDLPEVRDGLQDGSISLTTAAQLQNAFDRQRRNHRRKRGPVVAGRSAVPRQDSLLAPAAEAPEPPEPAPLLDVSARKALVQQAAGKSTRQVQELLAGVDPELTVPADKVRPLGDERYELKAVIDAECHRALERLRGLLSHVDPYMTLGQLVGRLAREGLDRHDPARPPRRPRAGNGPAGGERTSAPKQAATSRGAVTAVEQPAQPATKGSAPATSPESPDGCATSAAKSRRSPEERAASALWRPVKQGGRTSMARPQQGSGRQAGSARQMVPRPEGAATSAAKSQRNRGGGSGPAPPQPVTPARSATSAPKRSASTGRAGQSAPSVPRPSPASPPGVLVTGRGHRVRRRSVPVDEKRVRPGPHAAPSWRTSTKRPVAADSLAASEV